MAGQMDSFEGRLAYARYVAAAGPAALERWLENFDEAERVRIMCCLARPG